MRLNGDMLKDARDRKGLKQTEVSAETGISVPAIQRAENGEEILLTTGRELCAFLGIDLTKAVIPRIQRNGNDAA